MPLDAAADTLVHPQPDDVFRIACHVPAPYFTRRAGLAGLLPQRLPGIAHALVLVRIGRPQRAHLRRHLAQNLPVGARQHQDGVCLSTFISTPSGQIKLNRVRITQREDGDAPLHVATVADADNVQLPRKPGRHALHRVCRQRPRQPMQRGLILSVPLRAEEFRFPGAA